MVVVESGGGEDLFTGIVIVVAGAYWIWRKVHEDQLVITMRGGELTVLKSTDGAAVEALRAAIARAIAGR